MHNRNPFIIKDGLIITRMAGWIYMKIPPSPWIKE
jgi:hypothetical protein